MKSEIPQFLIEMSKQLNEQDNRITADPLFEVRYKKYLVTEQGYNESHWEIVSDNGDSLYHSENSKDYNELAGYLFDVELDWCKEFAHSYIDDFEIIDEESFEEWQVMFDQTFDPDIYDLPDEYKVFHMQEIEVTVNSHFTEADAKAFITRKQHDYPPLYTYAISMCYCWNMIELRKWIMSINKKASG